MWLEVSTHFNFFLLLWGAAERSPCCVYTQIDKLIDLVPDIPRFLGWVISTTLDRLWDVLCFFVSHILARFCLPPVATTAPSLFLINIHQGAPKTKLEIQHGFPNRCLDDNLPGARFNQFFFSHKKMDLIIEGGFIASCVCWITPCAVPMIPMLGDPF